MTQAIAKMVTDMVEILSDTSSMLIKYSGKNVVRENMAANLAKTSRSKIKVPA